MLSLVLLNLAGGDCVDDLKIVEADEGFSAILRKSETHGLKRKVRRAIEQRWRKEKKRFVPSPSAIFRYLSEFHDAKQEKVREQSDVRAFIPASNEHLKGLRKINKDMCAGLNTARLEEQPSLPGMEKSEQLELPFPTMDMQKNRWWIWGQGRC